MPEHDQRFKRLLREFLAEFLRLFFPAWAARLEFGRGEWLDQELFADPPHGTAATVDLLARVPLAGEPADDDPPGGELIVHAEVESGDSVEAFRRRNYDYYTLLERKYPGVDVWSVAVYLGVGLDGVGADAYVRNVWSRKRLTFEYDYVGLPGLDGTGYLGGDSVLGVALSALMRWPRERRVSAAVEALERIVASGETPYRKLILAECVQAYAPLDASQRIELTDLLERPNAGVLPMIKTWSEVWIEEAAEKAMKAGVEKGLAEGREKGAAEAARRFLTLQLEKRFGPLGPAARERVQALTLEQAERLALDVLTAASLRELGLED